MGINILAGIALGGAIGAGVGELSKPGRAKGLKNKIMGNKGNAGSKTGQAGQAGVKELGPMDTDFNKSPNKTIA